MVRTQIQMDEDQMEWLREQARKRGVSLSQLIREGVALFRAREELLPKQKKEKALAAIGRFASHKSDISERHDDYLVEAYGAGIGHDK